MLRLIALFVLACGAFGQTPDCTVSYTVNYAGAQPTFDNRSKGCVNWTVISNVAGFSALSLQLETASGAVTPGAFTVATATTGANPITSTDIGFATFKPLYAGWLRLNVASLTGSGTVQVVLYGYKSGYSSSGGGGAVIGGACTGSQFVQAIAGATAVPTCATPSGGGGCTITWTALPLAGFAAVSPYQPPQVGQDSCTHLTYIVGIANSTATVTGGTTLATTTYLPVTRNTAIVTVSLTPREIDVFTTGDIVYQGANINPGELIWLNFFYAGT